MNSKLQLLLLTVCLCACHSSVAQTTRLLMTSESGDYIGQGQTYDLDAQDGTFSASVNFDDGVTIDFEGATLDFNLDFAPPELRQYPTFLEGPYPGARRYPFNSPTGAGMSISGNGRGCNELFGEFDVLEIEIEQGEVVAFAADFVQYCGAPDAPSLTGQIRFQASGQPYPEAPDADADGIATTIDNCIDTPNPLQENADLDLLGDACDEAFTNTSIDLQSEPGDSIGQGVPRAFYLKDGIITASRNFANGVTVEFEGRSSWRFAFAAAGDAELTPGNYEGATRFPFNEVDEPGLSASGDGRGCNTLSGDFVVHEVEFGPDDTVLSFDASFLQYCGASTAALTGRVKFNAAREDIIFQSQFLGQIPER